VLRANAQLQEKSIKTHVDTMNAGIISEVEEQRSRLVSMENKVEAGNAVNRDQLNELLTLKRNLEGYVTYRPFSTNQISLK
jgi:hypothetical protein